MREIMNEGVPLLRSTIIPKKIMQMKIIITNAVNMFIKTEF